MQSRVSVRCSARLTATGKASAICRLQVRRREREARLLLPGAGRGRPQPGATEEKVNIAAIGLLVAPLGAALGALALTGTTAVFNAITQWRSPLLSAWYSWREGCRLLAIQFQRGRTRTQGGLGQARDASAARSCRVCWTTGYPVLGYLEEDRSRVHDAHGPLFGTTARTSYSITFTMPQYSHQGHWSVLLLTYLTNGRSASWGSEPAPANLASRPG